MQDFLNHGPSAADVYAKQRAYHTSEMSRLTAGQLGADAVAPMSPFVALAGAQQTALEAAEAVRSLADEFCGSRPPEPSTESLKQATDGLFDRTDTTAAIIATAAQSILSNVTRIRRRLP